MLGGKLSGRNKISEELAVRLAERIIRGELPSGAVVPSELELADTFEVSRPIAREAIQQLVYAGMLKVQHGKRTLVRSQGDWNVLSAAVQAAFGRAGRADELWTELYEVRYILETATAELAARRATAEERARISQICDEASEHARRQEPVESFLRLDRQFHEAIADASGNLALRQLVQEVHVYLASSWEASLLHQEDVAEAARQHLEIGQAVSAGDTARSLSAMAEHIRWAGNIEGISRPKS